MIKEITQRTAILAEKAGLEYISKTSGNYVTQAEIHSQIMKKRGVIICVYANASGFLWEMEKLPGGTSLGYSEFEGPNDSGVWDEYEDALEHALQLELDGGLDQFQKDVSNKKFHWGNYSLYLMGKRG